MDSELEYFKISNKVLDDFDSLMQMHLDKVKHLKIEKNIKNSKVFNIISLCLNLKTIEIDGDFKIDLNRVFSNICKKELLENIIITNSKLPTGRFLNKFENIKSLNLKNIKFSNINNFLENIGNKVEYVEFKDVDFENTSLEVLNRFENLKQIKLKSLIKTKFEKLDFMRDRYLENVEITDGKISFSQINNIVARKCKKNIKLSLESNNNFNNFINVQDENVDITVGAGDISSLIKNVNFYKITNLQIVFNKNVNFEEFIKILNKVKNEVNISISDFSKLNVNQAEILRQKLQIKNISILNSNFEIVEKYDIVTFIKIRKQLDSFINKVPEKLSEEEKYLFIYKLLLENIKYDESAKDSIKEGILKYKVQDKGFSDILKNCLSVLGIEAKKISGKLNKSEKNWNWLQVKINNLWFNSDIAFDSKNNKKMKYCLVSNEKMSKTHKFSNSKYCVTTYDSKAISTFWKEGKLIKNTNENKKIFENILEKVKNIKTKN